MLGNKHAVGYGYDVSGRLATLSAQGLPNLPTQVFASTHDLIGNQDKTASGTLTLPTTSAPCNLDGNLTARPVPGTHGNVSESLTTNGGVTVHYEYDPFGNLTRLTENTSTRFSYRFSTKPRDPATGLYYYGYRWYEPYTGRWINRDPIEEEGGVNLYGFVGNDGIMKNDLLGNAPNRFQGLAEWGIVRIDSITTGRCECEGILGLFCDGLDVETELSLPMWALFVWNRENVVLPNGKNKLAWTLNLEDPTLFLPQIEALHFLGGLLNKAKCMSCRYVEGGNAATFRRVLPLAP